MSLLDRLHTLAQSLCPESCPRCGEESAEGFCWRCRDDFERIVDACPDCGLSRALRVAGAPHACPAQEPGWQLDALRAPFLYAPPLAVYLQRLKFARQHRLGRALGLLLARELGAAPPGAAPPGAAPLAAVPPDATPLACDTLVAVPLHRRRLRERTFNQADEIARPIARRFGLRLVTAGISRKLHTPPQSALGRGARLVNLERAFSVRCSLDGARIAIIEDVITTGSTVNALAAALRSAGAARVEAWGVARTPETPLR